MTTTQHFWGPTKGRTESPRQACQLISVSRDADLPEVALPRREVLVDDAVHELALHDVRGAAERLRARFDCGISDHPQASLRLHRNPQRTAEANEHREREPRGIDQHCAATTHHCDTHQRAAEHLAAGLERSVELLACRVPRTRLLLQLPVRHL